MIHKKTLSNIGARQPRHCSHSFQKLLLILITLAALVGSAQSETDAPPSQVGTPANSWLFNPLLIVTLAQLMAGQLLQGVLAMDQPVAPSLPAELALTTAPGLWRMIPKNFTGFDVVSNLKDVLDAKLIVIGETHNEPLFKFVGEEIRRNVIKQLGFNAIALIEQSQTSPDIARLTAELGCLVKGLEAPDYPEFVARFQKFQAKLGRSPTLTTALVKEARSFYKELHEDRNKRYITQIQEAIRLGFVAVVHVGANHIFNSRYNLLAWITSSCPDSLIYSPKGSVGQRVLTLEENIRADYYSARTDFLMTNPDQLHDVLRQSIAIRPTNNQLYNLGVVLLKKGKVLEACTTVKKAIELQPEDFDSWQVYFKASSLVLQQALSSTWTSEKLKEVVAMIPSGSSSIYSVLKRAKLWPTFVKFKDLPGLQKQAKEWDRLLTRLHTKLDTQLAKEDHNDEF